MHSPSSFALARQGEAGDFAGAVFLVQDHVIAFRRRLPVAVDRLRYQDFLLGRRLEHAVQDRAQFLLRPVLELLEPLAVLPVAPLKLVQRPLVQVGDEGLQRHMADHSRTPERRGRHRNTLRTAARAGHGPPRHRPACRPAPPADPACGAGWWRGLRAWPDWPPAACRTGR